MPDKTPKKLNPDQIETFKRDGFVFPVPALSADDVAYFNNGITRAEAHIGGPIMGFEGKYRANMHLLCKWANDLVRHPAILDAVEDLIGPDILVWTSRFFIKEPHQADGAAWHQDATYFDLDPPDMVTPWVALSDAPIESGCMEAVPGSAQLGQLQHQSGIAKSSLNLGGQMIVEEFDQSTTVFGALKAGEISIHHCHLVHRSGGNDCDFRRIGLAIPYIPTSVKRPHGMRMPAMLVRGEDKYGHFDLVDGASQDFTPDGVTLHDKIFSMYVDAHKEQRVRHEAALS